MRASLAAAFSGIALLLSAAAGATNVTIGAGGRVVVEVINAEASFRNTLSIASPPVFVSSSGCSLEPSVGLTGQVVASEKPSQPGCRVELDANASVDGIQGFAAGTTFELRMCAQTDADADCEYVWSSNPANNADGFDHVRVTEMHGGTYPGRIYKLEWEDLPGGGDRDFNDLVAILRVALDTDGDGLWDDWETQGVDTDGDGIVDLDLPALGANPLRRDAFLEVDWMDCALPGSDCAPDLMHNHRPKQTAIAAIVQSFAGANITNPDGSGGITLHVDLSNAVPHSNARLVMRGACGDQFLSPDMPRVYLDDYKAQPWNFGRNNPRRFAYRYALFGHMLLSTTITGCAELPGNDLILGLAGISADFLPADADLDGDGIPDNYVGRAQDQAGILMHELGHTLSLQHGGSDSVNKKPNYLSVMNYMHLPGLNDAPSTAVLPLWARVDYSRVAFDLDENALDETAGIGAVDPVVISHRCPDTTWRLATTGGAIDWNCDGDSLDRLVASDVGCGPDRELLKGHFDWGNLVLPFQGTAMYDDAVVRVNPGDIDISEPTDDAGPSLSVSVNPAAVQVARGSATTFAVRVSNAPAATVASGVTALVKVPAGASVTGCTSDGGTCRGSGDTLLIAFGSLGPGAEETATVTVGASCVAPADTPIMVSAVATASHADALGSDNTAVSRLTVIDPPPVVSELTLSRTFLWPVDHRMVDVEVAYSATDTCGAPATELRVASNQTTNGTGDGNTGPDWEVVDAHHVRLRAERSGNATRVYTITVVATDGVGNRTERSAAVKVQRPQ